MSLFPGCPIKSQVYQINDTCTHTCTTHHSVLKKTYPAAFVLVDKL